MKRDCGCFQVWLRRALRGRWIVAGLLAVHAVLLIVGAVIHSPSVDEPVHLHAGLHMVREGYFGYNLGNPPLVDVLAAIPVLTLFPDFDLLAARSLHLEAVPRHGEWLMGIFTLSRLVLLPFSLLGGYCVFRWSGRLYGRAAALLALTLWCFSPCILAFGQQVTGDMAATSLGVLAAYTYWKWLRQPSWSAAMGAGIAAGVALLAKMVWILLFGLWPLLWLGWMALHPTRCTRRGLGRQAGQLLILLMVSVYVLNTGYGFESTLLPLSRYSVMIQPVLGIRLPESLDSLPVPLPYHYVRGLADVREVLAAPERSYLAGEWKQGGWWYYYLYGMAVKIPVGTLALLALAAVMSVVQRRRWKQELAMLVPGLVLFAFISVTTRNLSTQYRYILPVYPFLIIYASKAGRLLVERTRRQRSESVSVSNTTVAVAGLAAWAVGGSLWAYPHSTVYFNELAGGPSHGHRHYLGSSLDWGQDLWLLKRWKDRRCPSQPLWLGYRTAIHPGWLGLNFRPFPSMPLSHGIRGEVSDRQFGPQPGWYAVGVSLLYGQEIDSWRNEYRMAEINPSECAFLHQLTPVDRVGYSIMIYHLTVAEAERLRKEYGYPIEEPLQ